MKEDILFFPDSKIIFEDNHMLVLEKPAGLLTQPSGTGKISLEEIGKHWLKKTCHKKGNVFLEAVHRLDQSASGLVLFAKTSKALSRLMRAVREHRMRKYYYAQVERAPKEAEGKLVHYLAHRNRYAAVVERHHPEGKYASLTYQMVKKGARPILTIELETGRFHQIRCQLAAIGCPIWGDKKYGSKIPYPKPGIALHHYRMEIPHPITDDICIFISSNSI